MSSVPRASIALGVAAFLFWPLALVLLVVIGQSQACQPSSTNAAATAAAPAPNRATGPVKPGTHHYSQAQMRAAVAKYDPQQAVALGAIAMAETTGWDFPTWNAVAGGHWYHGPWAFQDATLAGMGLDANQLDGNLDYAAKAAAKLASTGITHGKWETWPAMAAKYMGGGAGSGAAAAVPVAHMAPAGGASTDCSAQAAAATGPGGVASADGWTFPLKTTQGVLRKGSQTATGAYETWCYTDQSNCHHDYNAADLMAPTGTPVLAPMDGAAISVHAGLGDGCAGLDNRGDTISYHSAAGDFFLGHMLTNSLVSHIKVGDKITAGEQLGVIGTIGNAQCTVPHEHIQLNPTGDAGGQTASFNIQPVLVKLFAKLPA